LLVWTADAYQLRRCVSAVNVVILTIKGGINRRLKEMWWRDPHREACRTFTAYILRVNFRRMSRSILEDLHILIIDGDDLSFCR